VSQFALRAYNRALATLKSYNKIYIMFTNSKKIILKLFLNQKIIFKKFCKFYKMFINPCFVAFISDLLHLLQDH
jgi:hypothetical protein